MLRRDVTDEELGEVATHESVLPVQFFDRAKVQKPEHRLALAVITQALLDVFHYRSSSRRRSARFAERADAFDFLTRPDQGGFGDLTMWAGALDVDVEWLADRTRQAFEERLVVERVHRSGMRRTTAPLSAEAPSVRQPRGPRRFQV